MPLLALRAPMLHTSHIVWTTYGTWLPGDARGWVSKTHQGVEPPDPKRERRARERMEQDAVVLTAEQRAIVERTIRDHCRIRNWSLQAVNVRTNHVHLVVTADRDPNDVMNQLKTWCSRRLSDAAGLRDPVAFKAGRRHWFTEGGDIESIEDETYLAAAIRYVVEGQ